MAEFTSLELMWDGRHRFGIVTPRNLRELNIHPRYAELKKMARRINIQS